MTSSKHLFIISVLFMFVVPTINGQQQICKASSSCTCSDNDVRVNCTGAGLPSMPHTLNPMIEELILRNNSIKQLGNYGELSHHPNLRILDLSYNKFERFSATPFSHQTLLKSLNLDGNGLSGISKDFFKGLKSLEELQLSRNSLGPDLSENYFQDLKQLKALNLSHNNIATISRLTFSSLELLSVLSLRDNDLGVEINHNSIADLINTQNSDLSVGNNLRTSSSSKLLTELRIDGLRPWILPNLEYLDLGQNLFTIIRKERSPFSLSHRFTTSPSGGQQFPPLVTNPYNGFQTDQQQQSASTPEVNNYWSSLRELKLDNCGIEFIEDNSFNALSSLTVLRLQSNKLNVIRLSTFSENVNLKILDLSRNQLVIVSTTASPSSAPTPSITSSSSTDNNVQDANNGNNRLISMKSLMVINLSGNNLSTIPQSLVPPPIDSSPALQSYSSFSADAMLNLKDNPLMCDCNLSNLRNYLISRRMIKAEKGTTINDDSIKSSNEILSEDSSSSTLSSSSSTLSSFALASDAILLNDMFSDEVLLNSIESFNFNEEDVKCYQKMDAANLSDVQNIGVQLVSLIHLEPVRDLFCDVNSNNNNNQNDDSRNLKIEVDAKQTLSWVTKDSLIVIMTTSFVLIIVIIIIVIIFLNTSSSTSASTSSFGSYFSKTSRGSSHQRPLPPLPVTSGSSFGSSSSAGGTLLATTNIPIFKGNFANHDKRRTIFGIKFNNFSSLNPFKSRSSGSQVVGAKNLFDYTSSRRKISSPINHPWSSTSIADEQCPNYLKTPNTSTLKNFHNFHPNQRQHTNSMLFTSSRTTDRKLKKNNLSNNGQQQQSQHPSSSLSSSALASTTILTSNHGYNGHMFNNSPLISDPLITTQHLMNQQQQQHLIGNNCLINQQQQLINHHDNEDNYYHRPVYEYLDGPLVGGISSPDHHGHHHGSPFTIDVSNIPPPPTLPMNGHYFRPSTADGFNY